MTEKTKIQIDAELYTKVYGTLINKVLPAFYEATNELVKEKYPDPGDFLINTLSGVTATVLRDSVSETAKATGMPLQKARKKILKQVKERTDLFIRRLDERENKGIQ